MKNISAAILALVVMSGAAHAQLVNTFASWDGTASLTPFGEPVVATFGQVFTVQAGYNQLDAVGLTVAHNSGGATNFAAAIMAWDAVNARPTGPLLHAAGPFAISATTGFVPLLINTGGIAVTAGLQYVAFVTATPLFDGTPDVGRVGWIGSDVYAGGGAVLLNNGGDLPALLGSTWTTSATDLAFYASFAAVPEPSTYGLVGAAALTGLVVLRKRRKVLGNTGA